MVKYKLLNSLYYKTPQNRYRIFIIGTREDLLLDNILFPLESNTYPILDKVFLDIPIEEKEIGYKFTDNLKKIFSLVPEGGNWQNLPIDILKGYLGKNISRFMINKSTNKYPSGIALRLSRSLPSPTIIASCRGKMHDRCHPTELRPINIRESARIQTFPDEWKFTGSISSQYRQIGNAVAVNMAYHLGKALIATLEQSKLNDEFTLVANTHYTQYSLFDLLEG